jgi:spoIIIJ-associated protein
VDDIAPAKQEEAEDNGPLAKPKEPFVEDGRADLALDFVIDVLAAMGMDCTVDLLENEEEDPPEEIRLEIEGKSKAKTPAGSSARKARLWPRCSSWRTA